MSGRQAALWNCRTPGAWPDDSKDGRRRGDRHRNVKGRLTEGHSAHPDHVVVIHHPKLMVVVGRLCLVGVKMPVNEGVRMVGVGSMPMLLADGRRNQRPRQQGHRDQGTQETNGQGVIMRT